MAWIDSSLGTPKRNRRAYSERRIRLLVDALFKAPWPTSLVDDLYKFSINERQHEALEQVASQHPEAGYYVLPLYSQWIKADRHASDLAQDTWLVPVSSLPLSLLTSLSTPASGRHRVELERNDLQVNVTVYSPEVVGEAFNAREYFVE